MSSQRSTYEDTEAPTRATKSMWTMTKELMTIALPIIIGQVFSLFVEMLNLVFAGHLDNPVYVAAAGLGNMYANITCLLVIYGLNSAIATLCSQAYGSGNLRRCGIYLNKGRIAIILFFIPIFAVMFLCERLLLLLNIDPETAYHAQHYTFGMIVALFFQSQFDATRQYLNALHKSKVITYMMVAASIYHLGILYICVFTLNWGMLGCSWGTVFTYAINLVIVTIYCKTQKDLEESFFFPTKECFENLWDYLRIGLPSSLMLSLEQWSYEVQAVLASYISVASVGAMAINVNFLTVLMMIPFGFSISAAVFVGKSCGEGSGHLALAYAKLITGITFCIILLISIIWVIFRSQIAYFFTDQLELLSIIESNSIYFAAFLTIHGTGLALAGAFRGLGKQALATQIILVAFYLVGNPLSIVFAFKLDIGMNGLTIGLICGTATMTLLYYLCLAFKFNWEQIAKDIRKKMTDDTFLQKQDINNHDLKENLLA